MNSFNYLVKNYYNDYKEQDQYPLNKKNTLTELLDKKAVKSIIENPDSIKDPWYGQLMKAPQILAYIIELDYWFEKYKVEIV